MKTAKKLSLVILTIIISTLFHQDVSAQLASWSLTANGTATNVHANITASDFSGGSGINAITYGTTGAYTSGWSIGALDLNDYYQISLSAHTGFAITITELNLGERRSLTGIRNFEVQWSMSSDFSSPTTIYSQDVPDNDLERIHNITALNIVVSSGNTVYFRIYGYNAESSAGTWRINDGTLTVGGLVEPVNLNDSDSQISAPQTQIAGTSISSLATTSNLASDIFKFVIADAGTSDGLPTIVKKIKIVQGNTNNAVWTNTIQSVILKHGINPILIESIDITNDYVDITIASENLSIADGTQMELTVAVYLKSYGLIDNQQIQLKINSINHGCQSYNNGSGFVNQFSADIESNTFNIDVIADRIIFTTIPSIVVMDRTFNVSVSTVDENNNIDLDKNSQIEISKNTGTGSLSSITGLLSNLINGSCTWNDLKYDVIESFTIKVESSGLTSAISNPIQCLSEINYLNDNFEDGNIVGWTESDAGRWTASSVKPLNGIYSLAHNYDNPAAGTDQISYTLPDVNLNDDVISWRFQIKHGVDPSANNNWGVFLAADQNANMMKPASTINGYVLGVNFTGDNDMIKLWKITNGATSEVAVSTLNYQTSIGTSKAVGFEIIRDALGNWVVKIDIDGGFDQLESIATGFDNTISVAKHFGLYYKYSSASDKKMWMDDVYMGAPILDLTPPEIDFVKAISSAKLRIGFNENLEPSTITNPLNYLVNNTIGYPESAVLFNSKTIELTFNQSFTDETSYSLAIKNVSDMSGNPMDSVSIDFQYLAFKATNVFILSNKKIDIKFNNEIDVENAFNSYFIVNNDVGAPISVTFDNIDRTIAHLDFLTDFVLNRNYTISITNVKDIYGNTMLPTTIDFLFYVVQPHDIVINELMIDVSPVPAALPAHKYIEIYNTSDYSASLTSWTLTIGTNTPVVFPAITIPADGYAIICAEAASSIFNFFGQTIPILKPDHLTSTTGKKLTLRNSYGVIIESITYTPAWYNDPDKNDGGWSIERIDPRNFCSELENWHASYNYVGGTPGRINSAYANNPDLIPPSIEQVKYISSKQLDIYFSENVDTLSAQNMNNYKLNDNIPPLYGKIDSENQRLVHIYLVENMPIGTNSISIKNIQDQCGNIMNNYSGNFDYYLIQVEAIEVKSKNQLKLYFSETVQYATAQFISNYYVDNSIGYPAFAIRDPNDSSIVHLTFNSDFVEKQINKIVISNLMDVNGNIMNSDTSNFVYYIPQPFDIVINEIMVDINPKPTGLPPYQYIELHNVTNYEIWISDWKFTAENQTPRKLPNISIPAKGFLLITQSDYERYFKSYCSVAPVLGSSDLTLSGKLLTLSDANNRNISWVRYSDKWYQDDIKSKGAWSLEKIDPENNCGGISNWIASNDIAGGTPGKLNSVNNSNIDNSAPYFKNLTIVSSNQLLLDFSEPLSYTTATDTTNYFVNNGIGYPSTVYFNDSANSINLIFRTQFTDKLENKLNIQNISDDCGNTGEAISTDFTYQLIHPKNIWITSENQLRIEFSEAVDFSSGFDENNYIDSRLGKPSEAIVDANNPNFVHLQFSEKFLSGITEKITISGIKDINGNQIKNCELEYTYYTPVYNDIVINEILFNPVSNGVDFVEIYNRSMYKIDLKNIQIASKDVDTKEVKYQYYITSNDFYLEPKTYMVLTTNPDNVKQTYYTPNADNFIKLSSLPTYADDKGIVVILDKNDSIIDQFSYKKEMHFSLLSTQDGVSLERIHFDKPTQLESNWHSASQTVGFATPAYQNSQFLDPVQLANSEIQTEPETISPDNDGYKDQLNIHYQFNENGCTANITIYDAKGRLIKKLVKNELLSTSGSFVWDGTDENKQKARIGIYIIFVEIFDLQGNVKYYKKTCNIANKLN